MRNLLRNKNAQTAAAVMSVILLIVGFAIAGLLFTFTQVLGGQTYELVEDDIDSITSYTFTDSFDSLTLLNETYIALGNQSIRASNFNIYVTANSTDVTSLCTLNATDGTVNITNHHQQQWLNNTACYANYTYDDESIKTAIKSGILSNFEAQQQIGDYMPIIALAIIITIVIGLIIGGIASRFLGPQKPSYSGNNNFL